MKWKPVVILLIATAIGVTAVSAQTCDSVSAALAALAANCTSMTRDTLCQDGQTASFDGIDHFTVDTLALGNTQASYPDVDTGRFVSMAFVGALDVRPVVETTDTSLPVRMPVTISVRGVQANVRAQPAARGTAVAKLDNGTQLNATGISRDGVWIRVQLPDQPMQSAWIIKGLYETDYDVSQLPVVSSKDPVPVYPEFEPMQAFSFTSTSPCGGVVLQSGADPARVQVNGVDLGLNGATAFVQNTGTALVINVLEGLVQVQAQGTTTSSIAGSLVSVPLDASAQASGAPEAPIPYDQAALEGLGGDYMQQPVVAAPAASADAIQSALVTPLSGFWKIEYPAPLTYTSVEGGQCGSLTIKQGTQIFEISVSDDGSSFSAYSPDPKITLGAGVRSLPGLYELTDFSFQVLSPTEMTATYDTNPLAACTSMITITAQWISPAH